MKNLFSFLPTIHWELISCGLNGHVYVGTDARKLRPEDALFAREVNGLRQYRCLRCGTWHITKPPKHPIRDTPPERDAIEVPIRGRLLRDRYVLRLIAADRAIHVIILSSVAILIFLFASHQDNLRNMYFQILDAFQGVNGGVTLSHELVRLQGVFDFKRIHIIEVGLLVSAYALLEAIEMVGLWRGKRWAEYLTFIATIVFIPYEVFELIHGLSFIKLAAFVINVAIAVYLLYAKRLFGVNGGARADEEEKEQDSGWGYFERTAP